MEMRFVFYMKPKRIYIKIYSQIKCVLSGLNIAPATVRMMGSILLSMRYLLSRLSLSTPTTYRTAISANSQIWTTTMGLFVICCPDNTS